MVRHGNIEKAEKKVILGKKMVEATAKNKSRLSSRRPRGNRRRRAQVENGHDAESHAGEMGIESIQQQQVDLMHR